MQHQHQAVFYSPEHGSNGHYNVSAMSAAMPRSQNGLSHNNTYYSNSNPGMMMQPMTMTQVPMNSMGSGAQWVMVQQQHQQMPVAYNGLGYGHGLGLSASAVSMTDEDERTLKMVAKDVVDQLREATQRVLKSIQRGHIVQMTSVRLLSKLGVTAEEPVQFGKPRNARKALALVRSFVSLVSSKLVPDLQKENQRHVVYVLTIVRAYISSMYAFVRTDTADDDEDTEEDASTDDSAAKKPQLAVTHTLSRLQHARNTIPEKLTKADLESVKQIEAVLLEIMAMMAQKKEAAGML